MLHFRLFATGKYLVEMAAPECGIFASSELFGLRCIEDSFDTPADAPSRFLLNVPYRAENFEDVGGVDVGNSQMANVRIGVIAKAIAPLLAVLIVFPSGFAADDETFRIDLERDRSGLLNLGFRSFGVAMLDRIKAGRGSIFELRRARHELQSA